MSTNWIRAGAAVAVLACTAVVLACSAVVPMPAHAQAQAQAPSDYRIGPADLLRIAVWNDEDLSGTVLVRTDGKISMPLLNDVEAAGLTPLQLREELITRLTHYMPAPEVSVIVEEMRSRSVSVLGEVKEPGRYELTAARTVLELIAEAGGFTEFASPSRIVIMRNDGESRERINFNFSAAISRRGNQENVMLKPGDVIVVP